MYWPNGVPRIYAVNGPDVHSVPADDDAIPISESSNAQGEPTNNELPQQSSAAWSEESITGLCVARSGHIFVTMTDSSTVVWRVRPTAVVAAISRSSSSLDTYGPNVAILMHSDSTILVVQTLNGFLLTYTITSDVGSRVYQQNFDHSSQARRQQLAGFPAGTDVNAVRGASIRFRMAIKIESGVTKALALDDELVVATVKPPAIQCIRWTPDTDGSQTKSELLSHIINVPKKTLIVDMIYDRAINLLIWVTSNGQAYAMQRATEKMSEPDIVKKLFHGHCFHDPKSDNDKAVKVTVNARFSLLTVGCADGEILVYTAKDYLGNAPLSNKLQRPASSASTGAITLMTYSPDGYCLFVGYDCGWATWSVFGKPGGNSFSGDQKLAETDGEEWLLGISSGCWIGGGSDIILTGKSDRRVWILETARSALTGCFSSANLARGLLQTGTEIILYRGHDLPDLITISGKDSLWHHAQYPPAYLYSQWPIRSAVVSQDGRYIAIAGRRGLAHYSVNSGRWRVFDDSKAEDSFTVRGGMCWYGHILIAAIESDGSYELRLYSRELPLNNSSIMHIEYLSSPVVFIGLSGEDSLLVYTHDNVLYHYIVSSMQPRITLVPVGQIAFNGIVRAPTRVRSISWVLPEEQLRNGDPSQDVKIASVLLLVDGNLVLLQPSVSDVGDLKYDMRVISHDVEYYILMRDQLSFSFSPSADGFLPFSPPTELPFSINCQDLSLRDSLWTFCGKDFLAWNDVQEALLRQDALKPINVPLDFYPLSVILNKGIVLGVEPEMIQRRDVTFTILKFAIRTHLFLPYLFRYSLTYLDIPATLLLSQHFSHLSYYAYALEVLLHHVLDDEIEGEGKMSKVDGQSQQEPEPLLPTVIKFLQTSLPTREYLDIVVQCTRKTELRSWRGLFVHLPAPKDLFEQALKLDSLKTAAGYLLVLQALEDEEGSSRGQIEDYVVRLVALASRRGDWELCGELARFLIALDGSGDMLQRTISRVGLRGANGTETGAREVGMTLTRAPSSPSRTLPSTSSGRGNAKDAADEPP